MAQNAITAEQVKSASNKKSAAVDKESIRDTVYKVSAAVSNAILVTLGMGLLLQTIAGFIH